MNKRKFRTELAALVRDVRSTITSEYRAFEGDSSPGIQLTVGADRKGWSYQTGDNSFTGGAYGYRVWAVTGVYRDSNSFITADGLIAELEEQGAFDKEEQS
jgi:hypothetical protein